MSSNIEIIGEWIQIQTAFLGRTDELFITNFLEACDYDVEKTKGRIVRYYELRSLYPRLMRNRDCLDEKHVKLFRQKVIYTDIMMESYELPVVLMVKLSLLESDDNLHDVLRALIMTFEAGLLHSARLKKYGCITILDVEGMKFTHAIQMTPSLSMQTFRCVCEGVPVKGRRLLIINAGSIVRAVVNVGSLVLPADLRKLITVSSGSLESLQDKVPPQCLPIEYGGTNGTLDENWGPIQAMLLRSRDHLLDDEQYGFNNDNEQES